MEQQGAIFDLDGTLLDSMGVWGEVDREIFEYLKIPMPEDYTEVICKMSFPVAAEYTVKRFQLSCTAAELTKKWDEIAMREYAERIGLKPHAQEYLLELKRRGVRIATATTLPRHLSDPCLKRHGIYELFDAFTLINEVGMEKGGPEIYLLAAEKIGISLENCVVYEDIYPGILGAKAAGMQAYGVADEGSRRDWEKMQAICDGWVTDYQELMQG